MKSEKQKMIAGEMYNPMDAELAADRIKTRLLLKTLNETREDEAEERGRILKSLLPNAKTDIWLQPPFYCDYGYNITVGERVFFNFNCVVLDVAPVSIGSRTLFGPNVQIYAATHPLNYIERSSGREYGKPVKIGEDVWIGGSAVICPGVTIGERTIIGAGSVVTKDIPGDVIAAGNPCKVIRQLDQ
ncbi:MAG: sugar O-acetyltransferase [Sphingobacteriales bacterium]|nr:MAG: sugar O-acetyltransferase [Sphingobacteriales bacterium]